MNTIDFKTHDLFSHYVLPTYARYTLSFSHGEGCFLWDTNGKKYLDCVAGIAVDNLGHAHPQIVNAIKTQAEKLLHTSNLFEIPEQGLLAKKLVELTGLHKAFFCNSGAEAIEAAIKFSRFHSLKHSGPNRFEIITFENSFHGRTLGAISATGQPKYQQGFGPLVPGFKTVPYNNLEAVSRSVTENTCAIFVEPVQGEGGVNLANQSFLSGLRKLCDEKNILLVLDEIQAGLSRTGSFLSSQNFGVKGDIVALAKGLASGLPMGATLVSKKVSDDISPGLHASTFGGNPFVSNVALTNISILSDPGFLAEVKKKGDYFISKLKEIKSPLISGVRGLGLMIGVELAKECGQEVVLKGFEKGVIFNTVSHNKVLRFVPPLIIESREIDLAVSVLQSILNEIY